MLSWALAFFIIAIVAAVFGFSGVAAGAATIAQILFFIFLGICAILTLLAYIRTGLTLAGVGATFIRFFGNLAYSIVGWVFIVAGAVALAVGVIRFRRSEAGSAGFAPALNRPSFRMKSSVDEVAHG